MDKMLIFGLGKGVGGARLAAKFLKIEFFFHFCLQKHEKSKKNLKIDYISAACRVNPPRPGVYF
jgi:hypothetical protein